MPSTSQGGTAPTSSSERKHCPNISIESPEQGSSSNANRWQQSLTRAVPAIVVIRVCSVAAFDGDSPGYSHATGFVVDKARGIILTNRHVVKPGPTVTDAVFMNKEEVDLVPIYYDPVHDFGFFRFNPKAVKFLEVAEIELNPDGAKVGVEIRVVGNDSGEKLSILPGILARLDRAAPDYGGASYNDFNTFYLAAASSTSGGSSGSPVLTVDGKAVALNCGARVETAAAFYLPLPKIAKALELIQRGERVWRGTIQTVLKHTAFDEARRLGLSSETEAALRKEFPEETGVLVVNQVIPKGPADEILDPGDVVVSMNGQLITTFLPWESYLDSAVGGEVKVEVERGGKKIMTKLVVGDLHEITPSEYLDVSSGVLHPLSYQQARNYNLPVGGVYLAQAGYMLERAWIVSQCLVTSVGTDPTPDLDACEAAFCKHPDGARVALRYKALSDRHRTKTAVITMDRKWFPMQRVRHSDSDGLWHATPSAPPPPSPSPDCTPATKPILPPGATTMDTSGSFKGQCAAPGDCVAATVKANENGGGSNERTGKCDGIGVGSFGGGDVIPPLRPPPLGNASSVAARISASLVMVSFDIPHLVDGVSGSYFVGVGVIVDKELGLVIVDRTTVQVALGDVMLTFNGSEEVAATPIFVHPSQNFSVVRFDPSTVKGAFDSAVLSSRETEMESHGLSLARSSPVPLHSLSSSSSPSLVAPSTVVLPSPSASNGEGGSAAAAATTTTTTMAAASEEGNSSPEVSSPFGETSARDATPSSDDNQTSLYSLLSSSPPPTVHTNGFASPPIAAAVEGMDLPPLRPGDAVEFHGLTSANAPVRQRTVVVKLERLSLVSSSHPQFTAHSVEVLQFEQIAGCLGGVFVALPRDDDSVDVAPPDGGGGGGSTPPSTSKSSSSALLYRPVVSAFWHSFSFSDSDGRKHTTRGLPAPVVQRSVDRIRRDIKHPERRASDGGEAGAPNSAPGANSVAVVAAEDATAPIGGEAVEDKEAEEAQESEIGADIPLVTNGGKDALLAPRNGDDPPGAGDVKTKMHVGGGGECGVKSIDLGEVRLGENGEDSNAAESSRRRAPISSVSCAVTDAEGAAAAAAAVVFGVAQSNGSPPPPLPLATPSPPPDAAGPSSESQDSGENEAHCREGCERVASADGADSDVLAAAEESCCQHNSSDISSGHDCVVATGNGTAAVVVDGLPHTAVTAPALERERKNGVGEKGSVEKPRAASGAAAVEVEVEVAVTSDGGQENGKGVTGKPQVGDDGEGSPGGEAREQETSLSMAAEISANGETAPSTRPGVGLDRTGDCLGAAPALPLQLVTVELSKARAGLGLSEEWSKKVEEKCGERQKQVLEVRRCMAGTPAFGVVETGDIILAVEGSLVTRFREVERAVEELDGKAVRLTVLRDNEEREISVVPSYLPTRETDRLFMWAGLMVQTPHLAVLQQGFLPKSGGGVYSSRWCYGSPAHKYNLGCTTWIVEVNGISTPTLDAFLEAVKDIGDKCPVRVKTVGLDSKVEVATFRTDHHYWPTLELCRSQNGCWTRKVHTGPRACTDEPPSAVGVGGGGQPTAASQAGVATAAAAAAENQADATGTEGHDVPVGGNGSAEGGDEGGGGNGVGGLDGAGVGGCDGARMGVGGIGNDVGASGGVAAEPGGVFVVGQSVTGTAVGSE